MKTLRERALAGEVLAGTWVVLADPVCAEITGQAGFDWCVIDCEHGMGDLESLLHQLQAMSATPTHPIVRVAQNEAWMIKRVLDLGPVGIMVPMVNNAEEATRAVSAMRYPPEGIRGLTPLSRPADYGKSYVEYFQTANESLTTVVQIETEQAVDNAEEIAAVDGVDVLLIGPMDLSLGLGVFNQFDHPKFQAATKKVVDGCKKAGKAAGILVLKPEHIAPMVDAGFTFIAISSDGGELATAQARLVEAFRKFK